MVYQVFARMILVFAIVVPFGLSAETVHAGSTNLSGQLGKVRGRLPRRKGDQCGEAVEKYKKAGGHSAYAQTDTNWSNLSFICGSALNRRTVEEAEKLALRSCEAGMKRWKYGYHGNCRIYASK